MQLKEIKKMPRPKNYNKTANTDSKYIRISEACEKLNIKREVLLYRLEKYQKETSDIIMYQHDGKEMYPFDGSKNPIFIDLDKAERKVPLLKRSETIEQLLKDVEELKEQTRILYEVCYIRGFLRRKEDNE